MNSAFKGWSDLQTDFVPVEVPVSEKPKEPKRCPIKLYVCHGPIIYGGVQTSIDDPESTSTPEAPKVSKRANPHTDPDNYERLFVFDDKNKDYPYMHSLANNGCTKVEMTEEEISNSDIS